MWAENPFNLSFKSITKKTGSRDTKWFIPEARRQLGVAAGRGRHFPVPLYLCEAKWRGCDRRLGEEMMCMAPRRASGKSPRAELPLSPLLSTARILKLMARGEAPGWLSR